MVCERCRNEIAANAVICPFCGTLTTQPKATKQPPTGYGPYAQGDYNRPANGYEPYSQDTTSGHAPLSYPGGPPMNAGYQGYQGYVPPQQQSYVPPYHMNQGYMPGFNTTIINNIQTGGTQNGALIAEIIFSLFGIYGVGWLIAGETTTGIIFLLCSFILYWPIMVFGTLITLGFGLIFLGPTMIAAIIINAVLLSNALKRKVVQSQVVIIQQPPMQMPPL